MTTKNCILLGAPVDAGQKQPGCLMGPTAYRVAGLASVLSGLGHTVEDQGDLTHAPLENLTCPNPAVHSLPEVVAWTKSLATSVQAAMTKGLPIIMGGDHAIGLGVTSGLASYAAEVGRPLFIIWLDAHSDFHTPLTTNSGSLHGTPVGYFAGREGFDAFPPFPAPVPADHICLYGIRSVDPEEHSALLKHNITPVDMRAIDEQGAVAPLRNFLRRVEAENGLLHVSLDVDFLDPSIAPAVGTTVPGGATFREAHLVMELLHESGLMTSLDLVELNPFLDERAKTARLMVDLVASLMGKKVFDRPTRSFP